jgi:hypothetical protein
MPSLFAGSRVERDKAIVRRLEEQKVPPESRTAITEVRPSTRSLDGSPTITVTGRGIAHEDVQLYLLPWRRPSLPGCRGEDAMYVDCNRASVLFGQCLGRHGAAASTRPAVAHNRPHRLALKVAKHELRT